MDKVSPLSKRKKRKTRKAIAQISHADNINIIITNQIFEEKKFTFQITNQLLKSVNTNRVYRNVNNIEQQNIYQQIFAELRSRNQCKSIWDSRIPTQNFSVFSEKPLWLLLLPLRKQRIVPSEGDSKMNIELQRNLNR